MNTISTGKFNWYVASSADKVDTHGQDISIRTIPISSPDSPQLLKTVPVSALPIPIVQQPLSTEFQVDVLPLLDSLDIKPTPTEPSRIYDEVIQAVSPLVDRISRNLAPKESSQIRRDVKTSFVPSHIAQKHPLVSSVSSPLATHIKRQKLPSEFNPDPLHLNETDFNDFNTVSGSDSVDFWFTQRVPSDIIALEEAERKSRMSQGVDSVLLGKMYKVQKQFMSQISPSLPVSMVATSVDSISQLKDDLIVKGQEIIDSAKDAFTMGSMSSTLKEIANESTTRGGDLVNFSWPARVPSDVSSALEKARSEWMDMHIEPYFKSQWKLIHSSLLEKVNAPASRGLMARTFGNVFQLTSKIGLGVVDLALDALHLGVKDLSQLESVRMMEEQERSRRMTERMVDPILDIKKSHVERELLSSSRFNGRSHLTQR